MLTYFKNDTRPYWQPTVTINGATDDMSTGYTFTVKLATALGATAVLTKTTGITGATGGVVTVAWSGTDLSQTAGNYIATLTAHRTSDSAEWTIAEGVKIQDREA